MAGYSGTPLIRKIGIREGHRVFVLSAPSTFADDLGPLPPCATMVGARARQIDVAILFVKTRKELERSFQSAKTRLRRDGMIWVCWPKRSSGVATELDFNVVQPSCLAAGLVDVKVCAVDETWSGLKFVYRKADR